MGITVHYRGKISNIAAIESLEDCVIDLALAFGGQVQIWRSVAENHPQRAVRGLLVDLDPGQETFSLLFSPEGDLIPLVDIEEAEKGPLEELPWCSVKTQFGSVEGHAALVEALSEIKRQFLPQLEVSDESDYWNHRDPIRLADSMQRSASIIKAVSDGLEKYPLNQEASEDAEIVAKRVTRVVQKVHQVFQQRNRQVSQTADAADEFQAEWTEIEAQWDDLYRDSAARSLRMQRHMESQLRAGLTPKEALESAMKSIADERSKADLSGESSQVDAQFDTSTELGSRLDGVDDDAYLDEPSTESLDLDYNSHSVTQERDPLLEKATQLYLDVAKLAEESSGSAVDSLLGSAGQLCGGLSQVLPLPPRYDMDEDDRGLVAVQLKRALRGAAFLRAALFNLQLDEDKTMVRSRLLEELETVQGEIVDHLRNTRA